MGLNVAKTSPWRLGKTIMELGGPTTRSSFCPTADLEMATQSIFFGAVGTAGQRCTSTRRVIMHESVADKVRTKLVGRLQIASDWRSRIDKKTLMGPMVDKGAVDMVQDSIQEIERRRRRSPLRGRANGFARAAVT